MSIIERILSFGIVISVSTLFFRFSNPSKALLVLCCPSNANGFVTTPTITSPENNSVNQAASVIVTSTAFVSMDTGEHLSSDWEIERKSDMSVSIQLIENSEKYLTSLVLNDLVEDSLYIIRVRHKSTKGNFSAWSNIMQFSTMYRYIEKPSILIPDHGTRDLYDNISFKSSPFKSHARSGHKSSTWSIKKKTGLTTTEVIVDELENFEYLTQYNHMNATDNSTYLVKVKYKDDNGLSSEWSETTVILK